MEKPSCTPCDPHLYTLIRRYFMRTLFSVLFCLFVAAPLVNAAGPPNPTPSDDAGNTAGGTGALINNTEGLANTAFGF